MRKPVRSRSFFVVGTLLGILAAGRAGAVDPARANALWVAESGGALKVATADGSLLLDLGDAGNVRAVAVDPGRSTVWLYSGGELRAYGFDGARKLSLPLSLPETARSDLAVHPVDGSVWLAAGKELRSVSAAGEAARSLRLSEDVLALAIDPAPGLLWVATRKGATAYDAVTGDPVRTLALGSAPDVRDLDVDPLSGEVWIAHRDRVQRFSREGARLLEAAAPGIAAVSAVSAVSGPGAGSVAWIATGKAVRRIGTAGEILAAVEPFGGRGEIAEIVADPADGSAWVTNAREIAQVGPAGQILRSLGISPPVHVWDLAIYSDVLPPELAFRAPRAGAILATGVPGLEVAFDDAGSGVDPETLTFQADGSPLPAACSFGAGEAACAPGSLLADGSHTLTATVRDFAGNLSPPASVTFTVETAPPGPPDPAAVAPAVDPTVPTDIAAATAFLYTGSDAIQAGVAAGAIEPLRAAVIRGRVLDREGAPLAGAEVTVLGHPELGSTQSRRDGGYDLAVNGGGTLVVQVAKEGYPTAQRQVAVPWRDYVWAEDVVLVRYDPAATVVISGAAEPQVARGSAVEDEDGSRRATLLFPAGTRAEMVLADGSVLPLPSLTVRATEYTVGERGPAAMPGPLPPSSGYTYAAELSVEEAVAAGAKKVVFSQPVSFYLENFLGFPVGGAVPAGYYDRDLAAWVPSDNGRIVRVLSVTAGLADLDVTGGGAPAAAAALAALGITEAERRELAQLYAPGQSLWRVPIPHFTPWDCNWPFGPPDDAREPSEPEAKTDEPEDEPCERPGSTIECQNRTLGEEIPLAGTPFALHYRSDRAPGRRAAYTLRIPLTGSAVPASLKRVELEVRVAGRLFSAKFSAAPGQTHELFWDGRDAYGRVVQGRQPAHVRIGYVYDGLYQDPARAFRSFGLSSGTLITGLTTRDEVTLSREYPTLIGAWHARASGLGGWTLAPHHAYDPVGQILYRGDGSRKSAGEVSRVISSLPNPFYSFWGPWINTILVEPKGDLLVADHRMDQVFRVDRRGLRTLVAGVPCDGWGTGCYGGDGGPATRAFLRSPSDLALDPEGNLYIADLDNYRIRKVDKDGIITTVAGTGVLGYNGDGLPALATNLSPNAIEIGADRALYIADGGERIRKLSPDGTIVTVAGDPVAGTPEDGVPALRTRFKRACDLASDSKGNLFIADCWDNRIRRIGPDGVITAIAGTGRQAVAYSPDGAVAKDADLAGIAGEIVVDGSGNVLFLERFRIRAVGTDGLLRTLGGSEGFGGSKADGVPAATANLSRIHALALGHQGEVWFFDFSNPDFQAGPRLRRVAPPLPAIGWNTLLADEGRLHSFDSSGRHHETRDALTGVVLYRFEYAAGQLSAIVDRDGNRTRIERDAAGQPVAIVPPFSLRTELRTSGGYLASVRNPAGEEVRLGYGAGGLLTSFENARRNAYTFAYDALGYLEEDRDPAGGFQRLIRRPLPQGSEVEISTALGTVDRYRIEETLAGSRRTNLAGGAVSEAHRNADGTRSWTLADGTVRSVVQGPDPRFGMQAPIEAAGTVRTPSGLTASWTRTVKAVLDYPDDPLSLLLLEESVTTGGRTFLHRYVPASRTDTFVSAAGRRATALRDSLGRLLELRVANLEPWRFTYDSRGRLASLAQGSGEERRTLELGYDAAGWLATMTDPALRTVTAERDGVGRALRQTLSGAGTLELSYDANGNIASLTPPGRPAHGFGYSPVDLQEEYSPPALGSGEARSRYVYDLDRRLESVVRPDGRNVTMSYDPAGRLSRLLFSRGQIESTYDPATAKLTGLSAPGGEALSYGYDGFLPVRTTWTGPVAGSVERAYDSDFRMVSQTVNRGGAVAYGYDPDGLLVRAGALTLTRDPGNGLLTGASLGRVTTAHAYSAFGELAGFEARVDASPILSMAYSRDKLGRITRKVETVGGGSATYDYSYDPAGRLETVLRDGALLTRYGYDANGNRTAVTGTGGPLTADYDVQDRLLRYGDLAYTYTANGELLTLSQNGHTVTYDYDELSNLRSVELPDGIRIEYVIDGQNRRVGKKVNGVLVQGFLYDGQLEPVAELDGSGTLVARFIYGTQSHAPDLLVKGGATYRILSDSLGSPRLVVNIATGEIVQRMDYDAFGNVNLDTNPGFQPFGFAGGLYDRHTKLVRFGARDYDARVGRWTAKDPILFEGQDSNVYGYAFSDPINFIDPSGLEATNCSPLPAYIKPEDGPVGILPPFTIWQGSPDGVYPLPSGPWHKTRGKWWLPDNDVYIDNQGKVSCTGGPCLILGVEKRRRAPDRTWVPANPQQLPNCVPAGDACKGGKP